MKSSERTRPNPRQGHAASSRRLKSQRGQLIRDVDVYRQDTRLQGLIFNENGKPSPGSSCFPEKAPIRLKPKAVREASMSMREGRRSHDFGI